MRIVYTHKEERREEMLNISCCLYRLNEWLDFQVCFCDVILASRIDFLNLNTVRWSMKRNQIRSF